MTTKTFSKQDLEELLDNDSDHLEIIDNSFLTRSRWYLHYKLIFQDLTTDKFYRVNYQQGATELQMDEGPFSNYDDEIECHEVEPREVTVTHFFDV